MAAHGNNITKFNVEIQEIQATLQTWGEQPDYILPQLFEVLLQCEGDDTPFGRYIEFLENSYNASTDDWDASGLMDMAEEKYKELSERNKMNPKKNKEIVALETKIQELSQHMEQMKTSGTGSRSKTPRDRTKTQEQKDQDSWMFTKPYEGEKHTRTVKDKLYHWCEGNGAHKPKWVRHDPKDCRGKDKDSEPKEPDGPATEEGSSEKKKVSWSAAMMATLNEDDE